MSHGTNNEVVIFVRHFKSVEMRCSFTLQLLLQVSGDGRASLDGNVLEMFNAGILPLETKTIRMSECMVQYQMYKHVCTEMFLKMYHF